jgi:predicted aldo/keto reductase-like oxidoreductase
MGPAEAGREETAEEFLRTFDTSMNYLGLDHVDLLALHGINNRQLLDYALRKGGCVAAARKLQKAGRARFLGFSTHATTDLILEAVNSGEFDYVNVHWYFVNDLNWPAIEAARARDMGVFIISPNDKGGKLYEPPRKLVELCAPLTPMQFNGLYCLAREQVHTLSCGASRPGDFDEHVAALEYYDRIAGTIAPIEARLRRPVEGLMLVTSVIPTYNRARDVTRAITVSREHFLHVESRLRLDDAASGEQDLATVFGKRPETADAAGAEAATASAVAVAVDEGFDGVPAVVIH